jgi:hypothetical protein
VLENEFTISIVEIFTKTPISAIIVYREDVSGKSEDWRKHEWH